MQPLTSSEEQKHPDAKPERMNPAEQRSLGVVLTSELSERCTTSEMSLAAEVSPGLCAVSSRKDPAPAAS